MHTTTSSCCICLFTAASIDTDLIQSIRNVITVTDHRRHDLLHTMHLFQQHMCNTTVSCRHYTQHVECTVVVGCKSSSRYRLDPNPNARTEQKRYGQGKTILGYEHMSMSSLVNNTDKGTTPIRRVASVTDWIEFGNAC